MKQTWEDDTELNQCLKLSLKLDSEQILTKGFLSTAGGTNRKQLVSVNEGEAADHHVTSVCDRSSLRKKEMYV